ncbi:CDP-diacylglycerol--glycerol-3-phosphate 3-phosphatidyltransferase [Mycoplasmopsis caviae]|uniref:CDP-diacylglycerol--glycerol-3-phosphate 3-phosphatidyltransferase n=1 Tax=Mycoplasmopsis caviae TaxID=55603 RepID=A0A3P8KAV1_9BACT|nr:CDP-diacylglycerol--glycerol-3-phosphate 3-phosphatidyltransferase [Mycoplasmopsis caviae]UUD35439.1 CDP-diacylglycerol--glycerol-3-phosphate 3-phosphatidyltransferase [Mycoplasmopsis caviae]VDR41784.1 CDP-diacylglycerol--glycerol-3-phosphate 3-phosphatidyltransferase [Mycoplasmopsis caviae]
MTSKINLPNKLTIFRLILFIPLLVLFISYKLIQFYIDYYYIMLGRIILSGILTIFLIGMITDYFDGKIARKHNMVTSFGKLWDPLADKIVVTSTLIFLGAENFIPLWIVIVFVIRDLIVDGSRVMMAEKNIGVEASIWGKMKTLFQTFAIIIILIIAISFNYPYELHSYIEKKPVVQLCIYCINIVTLVALFFSVYSGILYVKKIVPHLQMS